MRTRRLRGLDVGLLMTLALCLFAVWPVLIHDGLMPGTDTMLHVYRAAEMDHSWAHGLLLPDWAESFYYGYGSPVFHYYASLSYQAISLFTRLFGLTVMGGVRLLLVLSLLGAGAGMYRFTREYAGKLGGVIAAVGYVYSPYLIFTEPYTRGDFPELLAFALFPMVMWRFARLLHSGRARDVLLAALALGLLTLSHNLMAVVLFGLLAVWLAWHVLVEMAVRRWGKSGDATAGDLATGDLVGRPYNHPDHGRSTLRPYGRCGLAFLTAGLGIGLTAFFWLPVLLENDAVTLQNLTALPQLDYRNAFVTLNRLLAASPPTDIGSVNGYYLRLNLGLAQWALALVGFGGVVILAAMGARAQRAAPLRGSIRQSITRRPSPPQADHEKTSALKALDSSPIDPSPFSGLPGLSQPGVFNPRRLQNALFFALVSAALVFLMLPASDGVWSRFGVVRYLQFPWRLLGPAAFCLAVLAGMNAAWIERLPFRGQTVATAVIVALPVALAFPTLYVPNWRGNDVDTSLVAYHQAEISGKTSPGTTAANEFVPRAVYAIPGPTQHLLDEYAEKYAPGSDGLIDKTNPNTIPPDASVTVLNHGPQYDEWRITAGTPFTLEVFTFYFDGWTARIDGQPVEITPTDPHGFISFPVPAGEHTVRLSLGSTPARDLGRIVAIISALGLLALVRLLQIRRGGSETSLYTGVSSLAEGEKSPLYAMKSEFRGEVGLLAGLALVIVLAVIFMREGLAWVKSPPGQAIVAQHQVRYHLGDRMQVIGYDLSSNRAKPGDYLEMVIYWYASEPLEYNYASFIHVSAGGPPLAQADKQQAGELPTTQWPLGGYTRDEYTIHLPDDMPPGDYTLTVGLFTCDTRPAGDCGNGDRLPVTDADGSTIGDSVPLGTITVR